MDGIIVEYLVGLYLFATSFSQAESGQPKLVKIEFIRLFFGVVLVAIAIFGINLLTITQK